MEENGFKPITSQEELDAVLKDRLNRQSDKHSKELAEVKAKYADYDTLKTAQADYETKLNELNEQLTKANEKCAGYDSEIASRDEKIKSYELNSLKMKIIGEEDLSYGAIEFLKGETEDELRQSAESLKKLFTQKKVAPLAGSPATGTADTRTQALQTMLNSLTN